MRKWCCLFLVLSFPAFAESYKIGGHVVTCANTQLKFARLGGGNIGLSPRNGEIVLDPGVLKEKPITQVFVFYHECGHQYVGESEFEADCFAIKNGVYFDWLRQVDIQHICKSVAGPATSSHPSGPTRCANMYRCFNQWYKKKWPGEDE